MATIIVTLGKIVPSQNETDEIGFPVSSAATQMTPKLYETQSGEFAGRIIDPSAELKI